MEKKKECRFPSKEFSLFGQKRVKFGVCTRTKNAANYYYVSMEKSAWNVMTEKRKDGIF
jgi:hypothetical protein